MRLFLVITCCCEFVLSMVLFVVVLWLGGLVVDCVVWLCVCLVLVLVGIWVALVWVLLLGLSWVWGVG